jgi:hypothetical protein
MFSPAATGHAVLDAGEKLALPGSAAAVLARNYDRHAAPAMPARLRPGDA